MTGESETTAALRRAAVRAGYHSVKALVEVLKAFEAVIDELGRVRREEEHPPPEASGRIHIDVE
jgi:hypothetical protein